MAEYKMIFTWEREFVPEDEFGTPIAYTPLQYYSDYPEDGEYEGEAEFDTVTEYRNILKEWEGHLYQLFKGYERIGWGCFDPDSPVEEIVLAGLNCCGDCDECFWKRAYDNRYGGGDFWHKYKPTNCFVKEGMTKEDIRVMTLMEFTERCWYIQRIRVVDKEKHRTALNDDLFENSTITYVTPHLLRSVAYKEIASRKVFTFGVINNDLVVEVE